MSESSDNDKNNDKNININNMLKKEFSYPEQDDPDVQLKIFQKTEYYGNKVEEKRTYKNYKDIKDHRDELCDPSKFKPHPYQSLLPNFINTETPYKGLIIMHGLGSGKTFTGINIAEKFIKQCQKYRTKIYVLVPGPDHKRKLEKFITVINWRKIYEIY